MLRDKGAAYDVDGDLYFSVAADPDFGDVGRPRPRDDARAVRRARRRPRPAGQEGPARLPALAGRSGPASRPGTRRSAPAGPAGTSSAPRSRCEHLGNVDRRPGRRQRPGLPAPRDELLRGRSSRPASARSPGTSSTPGWSATTARRCPSPAATWCSSRRCARQGVDPAAIRLTLLAHHYRSDWEYVPAHLEQALDRLVRWQTAVAKPVRPAGRRAARGRTRPAGRRPRRARAPCS